MHPRDQLVAGKNARMVWLAGPVPNPVAMPAGNAGSSQVMRHLQPRRAGPPATKDEVRTMHARVSRFGGSGAGASPPRAEEVIPTLRDIDGFRGLISLVDRASGDALSITLWESEDAMRASEAKADEMRREMAAASGDEIKGVERYEVDALQLEP